MRLVFLWPVIALSIFASQAQPRAPDLAQASQLVVEGTNRFRHELGLAPVRSEKKLTEAAREFAAYLARTDRFDHDADGRHPPERALEHGYDYCLVSENIGFEFDSRGFATAELARDFVEGWKHSPPHRKNMEEGGAVDIGVAIARSAATGRYYGVQMFGRPRRLSVSFSVENRSGATVEYRVAARTFSLPPRVVRTHTQCGAESLVYEGRAVPASDGDRFVVARRGGEVVLRRE
jgi:uncharacterized protein YkwD